ncbi:hypothetical protein HanXRQr2_Chr07g0301741 [Helianthus annuus]|uniref:Uncharacterized protein n=1 Tax=Helianthus annuus TaxID=4232 RepID=A0A9K3ILI5_HELAN|nr:hypothetical protein HanXRQr2_Chr07g0301741 [Helianthus annuus]
MVRGNKKRHKLIFHVKFRNIRFTLHTDYITKLLPKKNYKFNVVVFACILKK